MKLLLTSSGFTNKSIANALLDLTKKPFRDLNLVFVPTAAHVEEGGKEWLIEDLGNCKKLGFKQIEIADIAAISENIWGKRFQEADVILLNGGNTFYLMEQLQKSGLDKKLADLLRTRVYVGSSAGSMVAGKGLSLASDALLYYENVGHIEKYDALNLVNLSIRPHLNSPFFPKVTIEFLTQLTKELPEPVYVLDDESAVKVDGNEITVVSEGVWKRFN